jgi:Rrf2 family protein
VSTRTIGADFSGPPEYAMRISKKAEYALRALVVMAREKRTFQIQELSRAENIPVKFLEQILLALKHAGILGSKRGIGGGYVLRNDPSEITVGEIIAVLDGPLAPVPCAAAKPAEACSCPSPQTCSVRLFMTDLREKLAALLGDATIEDLSKLGARGDSLAFDI